MTIQQGKAAKAYISVRKLNQQELGVRNAAKVFNLYTKLQKAWDFQVQEEEKLYKRHPDIDPKVGGIVIQNPEEREAVHEKIEAFNKDAKELSEVETEVDFEPFVISLDEEPGIKLSGEDIGNLALFITFE